LSRVNNNNRSDSGSSKYTINEKIRASEVRVIEGLPNGVYSKEEALSEAKKLGLDLVLINANASPAVCKIVDFKKFIYQEKMKIKDLDRNQLKMVMKEVKFTPNIGDNDYEVKKKSVIKFLEKGNKVKASVFFKGRTIMFKDRGELILTKLAVEIEEYGIPEGVPKMEAKNRMGFIIKPKKNK